MFKIQIAVSVRPCNVIVHTHSLHLFQRAHHCIMLQPCHDHMISGLQKAFYKQIKGIGHTRCKHYSLRILHMKKTRQLFSCIQHDAFDLVCAFIIATVNIKCTVS